MSNPISESDLEETARKYFKAGWFAAVERYAEIGQIDILQIEINFELGVEIPSAFKAVRGKKNP
jgi:hypothetical protein